MTFLGRRCAGLLARHCGQSGGDASYQQDRPDLQNAVTRESDRIRMLSIPHSPSFFFFHLGVSRNCFCETSFLAAPHVRLSFWVCFVQLLAAPLAQIFSLQAVQIVKICQRHHKIIPFWSVALPTPADPSRVGLPKWKDPNMAARAAIHLRGKYEVGDLLGEGAIQKAT